METFEEKARRLPPKVKEEMEAWMNVVLGITSMEQYNQALLTELDSRLEKSKVNAEPAENVLNDLAQKYGLRGKD